MSNWLNKSIDQAEKVIKTDLRYLIHNGFWLTTGEGLSLVASFFTSIAFANWLPAETYGIYRYILSALTILTISTLGGINDALVRAVSRNNSRTIFTAIATQIKWGLLGGLGGIFCAFYYYWNGNIRLALLFLLAAVFVPIMDPMGIYTAYLSGKKAFRLQTIYEVIIRIGASLAIVTAVFLTRNIFAIIGTYLAVYTGLRALFLFLSLRHYPPTGENDLAAITFGKHLSLMEVIGTIANSLDKILVFHFVGAVALAGYYLALIPYKQITGLFAISSRIALPNLAKRSPSELRATLLQRMLWMYVAIIPIVALYWIFSPVIFGFIYREYTSYVFMSQILMFSLLCSPTTILYTAFVSQLQQKKLYLYSTFSAVSRLVLVVTLVPLFGLWGAAISFLASTTFNSLLLLGLFTFSS